MAVNRRKYRKYDTLEEVILAFIFKELAKQLEVEKSIKYKEYREVFGKLIEEYTKEEVHDKLILLVREAYGSKDEDTLYEVAKTIFKN